jgi:hypothetical protein
MHIEQICYTLPISIVLVTLIWNPLKSQSYTVKKLFIFPTPLGMSLTKISLAVKYLLIPCQGEFGKWHLGWGR